MIARIEEGACGKAAVPLTKDLRALTLSSEKNTCTVFLVLAMTLPSDSLTKPDINVDSFPWRPAANSMNRLPACITSPL